MIQEDEIDETLISVVTMDRRVSASSNPATDDKMLSSQTESGSGAPKGKAPKARTKKKKPGPRGQKSQSSKPSDLAEIIGVSEQGRHVVSIDSGFG